MFVDHFYTVGDSYALLELIHKAGSYFMLRGKCNMTGKITACFLKGKSLTNFIDKDLKEPLLRKA